LKTSMFEEKEKRLMKERDRFDKEKEDWLDYKK